MLLYSCSMPFRYPVVAIIAVLVLHLFGMFYLYGAWHSYDMVMHFLGGAAMGLLALSLWDRYIKNVTFTVKHRWSKRIFFTFCILGFTAMVGVVWEWYEFAFDMFVLPGLDGWVVSQPSVADTMADLFLDLSGAFTVSLLRMKV